MTNIMRAGCLWIGLNLLALIFLVVGGWYGYGSYQLVSAGGQVVGTVVEMEASYSDGSTTYSPVVEYVVDGEVYRFHGGSASNPPAYRVGQEVTMLYDRADPERAQINNFGELWLLPAIFIPLAGLVAVIATAVAIFQIFFQRRVRPVATFGLPY